MKIKKFISIQFSLILMAGVFYTSNALAQSDKYEQLLGTWELVIIIEDEEQPFSVLVFEMKKGKLTAYWENDEQTAYAEDLKVEKNVVTFKIKVEVDEGEVSEISCKAELEKNDKMKGEAVSDVLGNIEFTGKRVKKK